MISKCFNRPFEMYEFPYFVPKKELDYNEEYAKRIVDEDLISFCWNRRIEKKQELVEYYNELIRKMSSYKGGILEICSGPAGGHMPIILFENYDANIMISDLCPTVVREWKLFFDKMKNPPPNIEYAAFNCCDMPFNDESLDVISGSDAIVNIEGDRKKVLSEIYRVLKHDGLFVMDDIVVNTETYTKMDSNTKKAFTERYPNIFLNYDDVLYSLGFSSIETTITGTWSNKDDDSSLADFTRSLGTELIFNQYIKYCIK